MSLQRHSPRHELGDVHAWELSVPEVDANGDVSKRPRES